MKIRFKYRVTFLGGVFTFCHNGIDLDQHVRYILGENSGNVPEEPENIKIEVIEVVRMEE